MLRQMGRGLCALSVLPCLLIAQQGRGTISGTVTDQSGATIRGAKITILNTDTNAAVVLQSNGEGNYTSPPLNVGAYEVAAEQAGFKKEIHGGIRLQVDQRAEINLQMSEFINFGRRS